VSKAISLNTSDLATTLFPLPTACEKEKTSRMNDYRKNINVYATNVVKYFQLTVEVRRQTACGPTLEGSFIAQPMRTSKAS
jgi:hypothetical protein